MTTESKPTQERLDDLEGLVRALTQAFQDDRSANASAFDRIERAVAETMEDEVLVPVAWVDYAAAGQWVELADWVDWLVQTYEIRTEWQIRTCWPAHPGVAEELAALWKAWKNAARKAMNKDSDDLAFWHDRYLAPTLHRLPALYRVNGCRTGHQETSDKTLTDRSRLPGTESVAS